MTGAGKGKAKFNFLFGGLIMAISSEDLATLGKVALDQYVRNAPVDQVTRGRPFLEFLLKGRKQFLGAKEGVVLNVRKSLDANFQWGYGEDAIQFKPRNTTDLVTFKWARATDTLSIALDRLFGAGIEVREGKSGQFKLEQNEKVQLHNLLDEQASVLQEGFFQMLDREVHRNGTSSANALVGLDALISTTPATGTVAGIDASKAAWWRNNAQLSIAPKDLPDAMEKQWRACTRFGGTTPDFILAGSDFIDAYRGCLTITQNADAGKVKSIDAGIGSGTQTGIFFKGVPIVWDPSFEDLDEAEAEASTKWTKRCYFLNSKRIQYQDDGMNVVTPVRPYNVLALYQMVIVRSVLTVSQRSAHAVLAIA